MTPLTSYKKDFPVVDMYKNETFWVGPGVDDRSEKNKPAP